MFKNASHAAISLEKQPPEQRQSSPRGLRRVNFVDNEIRAPNPGTGQTHRPHEEVMDGGESTSSTTSSINLDDEASGEANKHRAKIAQTTVPLESDNNQKIPKSALSQNSANSGNNTKYDMADAIQAKKGGKPQKTVTFKLPPSVSSEEDGGEEASTVVMEEDDLMSVVSDSVDGVNGNCGDLVCVF